MSKKTLVIGASDNPDRYAYKAVYALLNHAHEVIPLGIKKAEVAGLPILNGEPPLKDIDTVTLYIAPPKQAQYYKYVLSLKPKRVIFNPGTENPEFEQLLSENGIEPVEACTLVMLSVGNF